MAHAVLGAVTSYRSRTGDAAGKVIRAAETALKKGDVAEASEAD